MTEQPVTTRSYGCTFACGNPYDYIVITVADGTTEFLCMPCYVKLAIDMIKAVTEPDSPEVLAAVAAEGIPVQTPMAGGDLKRRGHNAPVTNDSQAVLDAYDDVVTEDELPEAFK